jgi:RNA polymerase sigma-70 factor (ECF subfamily)
MLPQDEGNVTAVVNRLGLGLRVSASLLSESFHAEASSVPATPDIEALTRAVKRGDPDAFAEFYDLYSFRIYKFLLVLARGDENEAREACQAVFVKLAKRVEVFNDERRLWAWLCVLTKNTFLDQCRSRQRQNRFVPLEELPAEPAGSASPEERLSEAVHQVLATLAPEEREMLEAAYVDKRPLQQLADEAGLTYKAVESRLGRLRQKLKQQLLKGLRHENES